MALVDELSFEGVEGMLLSGCQVAETTWERLVVGVGDAFWEGADAGRFEGRHGRLSKRTGSSVFETQIGTVQGPGCGTIGSIQVHQ